VEQSYFVLTLPHRVRFVEESEWIRLRLS
jgi:hypothetical protein